jgi:hypothetical protein
VLATAVVRNYKVRVDRVLFRRLDGPPICTGGQDQEEPSQ